MKYILALLLSACGTYYPPLGEPAFIHRDVYCEPVHQDLMLCREDNGTTHRCVVEAGNWECRTVIACHLDGTCEEIK